MSEQIDAYMGIFGENCILAFVNTYLLIIFFLTSFNVNTSKDLVFLSPFLYQNFTVFYFLFYHSILI